MKVTGIHDVCGYQPSVEQHGKKEKKGKKGFPRKLGL